MVPGLPESANIPPSRRAVGDARAGLRAISLPRTSAFREPLQPPDVPAHRAKHVEEHGAPVGGEHRVVDPVARVVEREQLHALATLASSSATKAKLAISTTRKRRSETDFRTSSSRLAVR